MRTAAIIPAAGRGERLGPGVPKALRELGGAPLLVHAVRAVDRARSVDLVVVAAPPDDPAAVERLLADYEWIGEVLVVAGGLDRQQSVARALVSLPEDVDVVLVHDAARPLAPPELVDAVAATIRRGAAACVPVVPLADTVKVVADDQVVRTLDRSSLRAVQTPQGFRRGVLAAAHAAFQQALAAGGLPEVPPVTDDAGMVERQGVPVVAVPGSEEAFKVTRPLDLLTAEALLTRRRAAGAR
ncbi:2-C-methyl-D-erythritol 4-phosphate cytidylyltransferase [Actinopolymorpha singaporensis]|uniref:2-C-methyl-D-erythritol 4-phosphate cytidylyltransferase n=1 Tax=Actinopolymorpha singaporensis TaxID=117157 RepID=A0A1H1LQU3_9ACTN|nr:2-C-methyl-D-erythritol 4-phosphate cytidylyltransferase [Actinopolymorpha singaporensis]SDR76682.1 2-C-methyl-D-erythritol 4-phosphate cytidylyltransferase [Actinopolymorpha singaporensis]